jgi:hypothetical protein
VAVKAQQGFQSGDQRTSLLALAGGAVGEGRGRDDGEPAGDLAAADTSEQALRFDIDAGINECGRQPFVIFSWSETSAPVRVARFRLWISTLDSTSHEIECPRANCRVREQRLLPVLESRTATTTLVVALRLTFQANVLPLNYSPMGGAKANRTPCRSSGIGL